VIDYQDIRDVHLEISSLCNASCPWCPRTFWGYPYNGAGQYHQVANAQLIPLIAKNNALDYPLEQCIEWFQAVENAWQIKDYTQGRLVICDQQCGQNP
jgi:hypothetical protein